MKKVLEIFLKINDEGLPFLSCFFLDKQHSSMARGWLVTKIDEKSIREKNEFKTSSNGRLQLSNCQPSKRKKDQSRNFI